MYRDTQELWETCTCTRRLNNRLINTMIFIRFYFHETFAPRYISISFELWLLHFSIFIQSVVVFSSQNGSLIILFLELCKCTSDPRATWHTLHSTCLWVWSTNSVKYTFSYMYILQINLKLIYSYWIEKIIWCSNRRTNRDRIIIPERICIPDNVHIGVYAAKYRIGLWRVIMKSLSFTVNYPTSQLSEIL